MAGRDPNRAIGAASGWLRGNALSLGTAVLVMGSMLGVGALVLSVASREDSVRDAQIAVNRLMTTTSGFWAQPLGAVDRGTVTPPELAINHQIGATQRADVDALRQAWPGSTTDTIEAGSTRASTLSTRSLELIAADRPAAAGRMYRNRLRPAASRLEGVLRRAGIALDAEARMARDDALVGTLAITGAVGALLVAVVLFVSGARRRRARAEAREEVLRHQAFHDDLTGLANRALLVDRLAHALARGTRSRHAVTVLLVDVDDFKSINDSLGHSAGDRLLVEVAQRLAETMRPADTVSRFGGDEFAIVLDESDSEADDERAATRILAAVEEPFVVDGRAYPVTASLGIARSTPGQATPDQLIRDADLAMYSAKARGKRAWAAYRPEMHIATEGRLQLKADVVNALAAGDQLELHYQPVVALDSERVVGLEVLLRWNHPTRGPIPPRDFIPLAEETGAIVPIGRWVLREACRRGGEWDAASGGGLLISVNVSARQLTVPRLPDYVRDALRDSGLPAERLVIEVTERELMRDMDAVLAALRRLKGLGVRVAIDHFGASYSSLSGLEDLPIDILKVDRSFASTPHDGPEQAKLQSAVMDIGDSLDLQMIAEGIETPDQLDELRSLHYPLAQGFLFSRPVARQEVEALFSTLR